MHGEEHSEVADSCLNLAVNCSRMEEYEQAIEYDKKALSIN